ncbi:MAG TPA: hypothetical protein VLD83_14330 [Candidatus Binatia bacterium]|nr:hypothetical protein [Candidatus Binatia bacterium]
MAGLYALLGAQEMGWFKIKRGPGKQWVEGKTFRLAEEIRYMQRRAARQEARIVTVGQLLLFSTKSGDAWLLDASDQLATPLARDGEALSVHIEETDTNFAIGWTGAYRITGAAFVYRDKDSGNVRTILGYPTQRITHEISNIFG